LSACYPRTKIRHTEVANATQKKQPTVKHGWKYASQTMRRRESQVMVATAEKGQSMKVRTMTTSRERRRQKKTKHDHGHRVRRLVSLLRGRMPPPEEEEQEEICIRRR
jgi:hypothetical protein